MKTGEIYNIKIEKLTNLGLGLAKVNGFVVFVNNACPGDELKVKVTKVNKNFANADIEEIITPSLYRTRPFCPMQKVCGACQLQYIDYEYQLELKKQITEDAMRTIGGISTPVNSTIKSPEIMNYRCKIQYPVSRTKNSGRMLAGYYKPKTHEIVNIKYCPIQPQICDKIIEYIRQTALKFGIKGFEEKKHSGDLRHIIIRHSKLTKNNLVVLVVNATKNFEKLEKFAKEIYNAFDEISGVCINYNSKKTNVILGNKTECVIGEDYIEERILDKTFKVGAETFFQVNPQSAENIFRYVKDYIRTSYKFPIVLDAYAGITAFGIVISDICKKVVSVEENKSSCEKAKEVIKANNIKNIEINNTDASEFIKQQREQYDVVILDPPRKGCTKEGLEQTYRLAKDCIIYVSCNPATLARDLKILEEMGATIEKIQPFDMFCHTYHIENVAIIKKDKYKLLT